MIKFLYSRITLILIIMLSINSCVTVKRAPQIEDYKIFKGNNFQKKNFTSNTVFVFKNDLKMIDFRSFLAEKFELTSFKSTKHIPVQINGTEFDFQFFTLEKNEKSLNLVDAIINIDPKQISLGTVSFDYVGISVSNQHDLDCLSENSIYHSMVIKYLIDLKDEYLNL